MQMANYTLFAQKKSEACIALFVALNQALECLASSASLLHQDNTFEDLMKVILEIFLLKLDLLMGKKTRVINILEK